MTSSLLTDLRAVRAKVEAGWHQGCYARDAAGRRTLPSASDACSWCLLGAAMTTPGSQEVDRALRVGTGAHGVAVWNDLGGRTKEEVLALVDLAIEREEKRLASVQSTT